MATEKVGSRVFASINDLPELQSINDGNKFIVQTADGTVLIDYSSLKIDLNHTNFKQTILELSSFASNTAAWVETMTDDFNVVQNTLSTMKNTVDSNTAHVEALRMICLMLMGWAAGESTDWVANKVANMSNEAQSYFNDMVAILNTKSGDWNFTQKNVFYL